MVSTIIGESVQGESHKRHNVVRQDSYLIVQGIKNLKKKGRSYRDLPEGVSIISVADGHGSDSCPYSDTGSRIATEVFCDMMTKYLLANDVESVVDMKKRFNIFNQEGEIVSISKKIIREWETRVCDDYRTRQGEVPVGDENQNIMDNEVWKKYGTTLLGMVLTPEFIFSLQLGDGDIVFVNEEEAFHFIKGDKILGVETHSISKQDSWKKTLAKVLRIDENVKKPFMLSLSTDGWMNSHASEQDFFKTCREYYNMFKDKKALMIDQNLENWLAETSRLGCGDDITVVFAFCE